MGTVSAQRENQRVNLHSRMQRSIPEGAWEVAVQWRLPDVGSDSMRKLAVAASDG